MLSWNWFGQNKNGGWISAPGRLHQLEEIDCACGRTWWSTRCFVESGLDRLGCLNNFLQKRIFEVNDTRIDNDQNFRAILLKTFFIGSFKLVNVEAPIVVFVQIVRNLRFAQPKTLMKSYLSMIEFHYSCRVFGVLRDRSHDTDLFIATWVSGEQLHDVSDWIWSPCGQNDVLKVAWNFVTVLMITYLHGIEGFLPE